MRRALIAFLVVPVLLLVAACGGSTDSAGEETKEWLEVVTLSGADLAISPSFQLEGGEQKLEYTIEGGDMLIAGFYVEEAGMGAAAEGALPDVASQEAGKGSRPLRKSAGTYKVVGEAGNCTWTCTLFELR